VLSVRFSPHRAALAACLVALCGLPAIALSQGPPPAGSRTTTPAPTASGTNVAVIDIALIFKHHDRFNGRMADIKREIEQFEAFVRSQQADLKKRAEELQQYNASSQQFKEMEKALADAQAKLQVDIGLRRKDFLEQEARVYFQIYREIEQSVAVFAQKWRIGLVLRYNSDDMKEDDRASVLQGVNRAVVYHGGLDITPQIIAELNRRPFNPNDKPIAPATTPAANVGGNGAVGGSIARPPIVPGKTGPR
jgi:Skp family chaperone for outer membrane proteins